MTKKRHAHDQEAWTNATKVCRLTSRQVEMARALGMNPRKLPRLRPSPQQRWKLPVGEFIEECYRKRFGGGPRDQHARGREPRTHNPSSADLDASAPEHLRDPACQLSDLACYLVNLADDLQRWVVHGSIDPELLPEIREELRAIATALETGDPISPVPAIPLPPGHRGRGKAVRSGHSTMKTSRSDWNEERLIGRRPDDDLERAAALHRVVTHDLAFGKVEIRGGASFTKSC